MENLGWKPKVKLTERVKEFAKWMLANPRWLDQPEISEDGVVGKKEEL